MPLHGCGIPNRACRFAASGRESLPASEDRRNPGRPGALAVDAAGNVYVAESRLNCVKANQAYLANTKKLFSGDEIFPANGDLVIGANVTNHANNLFNGLIDWATWKASVD